MWHSFAARDWLNAMVNTSFSGSDVDDGTGDICETGGCGESSDCRESADCGEAGNCWEFRDCGEPGGVSRTGGGEQPDSRSTLKSK